MIKLTQDKYFELRKWTEANADELKTLTARQHAEKASQVMGFEISPDSCRRMRAGFGWNDKPIKITDADRITSLEQRVAALESAIASMPKQGSLL